MKKQQVFLGGLFVALPFIVVAFLSGEVTPADSVKKEQKVQNPQSTCMREQGNTPEHKGDCTVLQEPQGG